MKTLSILWALVAVAVAAGLSACIADSSSPDTDRSRGVVLSYPPDKVWEETKITFSQIGRITHVDEKDRLVDVAIGNDTVVLAIIDTYDQMATKTILRISARQGAVETPDIASEVLAKIQERLLTGR